MDCVICKVGTTHKNKASFTVEKAGAFIVFSNVDAQVCDNCGEAYFDVATTKRLEQKAAEKFKKGAALELIKL